MMGDITQHDPAGSSRTGILNSLIQPGNSHDVGHWNASVGPNGAHFFSMFYCSLVYESILDPL